MLACLCFSGGDSWKQEAGAENWIGMVCQQTSPAAIAEAAIEDAKFVCTRQYGDAPDVTLHGRLDLTFSCECRCQLCSDGRVSWMDVQRCGEWSVSWWRRWCAAFRREWHLLPSVVYFGGFSPFLFEFYCAGFWRPFGSASWCTLRVASPVSTRGHDLTRSTGFSCPPGMAFFRQYTIPSALGLVLATEKPWVCLMSTRTDTAANLMRNVFVRFFFPCRCTFTPSLHHAGADQELDESDGGFPWA